MIRLAIVFVLSVFFAPSTLVYGAKLIKKPQPVLSKDSQSLTLSLNTGVVGQKVSFVSSFSGWDPETIMLSEVSPGYYSLSLPTPWVPIFYYKFIVDDNWIHDPENSQRESDGYGGYNSVFETKFKESSLFVKPPQSKAWLIKKLKIKAENNYERDVVVIYPPFSSKTSLRTLYFNDGGDYLNFAFIQNVLANYYLKTGQAFIGVLIPPIDRMREYGDYKKNDLDSFIVNQVIPYIEVAWNTGKSPDKRLLMGPSLAGLAALRTGLTTQAFGAIVSQSGAFWYVENHVEGLIKKRVQTPRLYFTYGLFEGEGIIGSNKKIKELMDGASMEYIMIQTPTRHDWLSWRNQLEGILDWYLQN